MGQDADEQKDKKDDPPKHSVEDDKATGKQPGDIDPPQYPPRDDR
jgi:hypothetical protein